MLASYPASLSMTAFSYAFGACLMSMTGFFFANEPADWNLTGGETFAVFYAASVSNPSSCIVSIFLSVSSLLVVL